MNLRQKIAWILLILFLGGSFVLLYYLMDIADQFTLFSLSHSKLHEEVQVIDASQLHKNAKPMPLLDPKLAAENQDQKASNEFLKREENSNTVIPSFWHHIVDLPAPVLIVLCFILYCQIFALLYFFTLPHIHSMKNLNVCIIPFLGWYYIVRRLETIFACSSKSDRIYISKDEKDLSFS